MSTPPSAPALSAPSTLPGATPTSVAVSDPTPTSTTDIREPATRRHDGHDGHDGHDEHERTFDKQERTCDGHDEHERTREGHDEPDGHGGRAGHDEHNRRGKHVVSVGQQCHSKRQRIDRDDAASRAGPDDVAPTCDTGKQRTASAPVASVSAPTVDVSAADSPAPVSFRYSAPDPRPQLAGVDGRPRSRHSAAGTRLTRTTHGRRRKKPFLFVPSQDGRINSVLRIVHSTLHEEDPSIKVSDRDLAKNACDLLALESSTDATQKSSVDAFILASGLHMMRDSTAKTRRFCRFASELIIRVTRKTLCVLRTALEALCQAIESVTSTKRNEEVWKTTNRAAILGAKRGRDSLPGDGIHHPGGLAIYAAYEAARTISKSWRETFFVAFGTPGDVMSSTLIRTRAAVVNYVGIVCLLDWDSDIEFAGLWTYVEANIWNPCSVAIGTSFHDLPDDAGQGTWQKIQALIKELRHEPDASVPLATRLHVTAAWSLASLPPKASGVEPPPASS